MILKKRKLNDKIVTYKECIAESLDKIIRKVADSEIGCQCAKKIIDEWLVFINFQNEHIDPLEDTVLLYKLLNYEFDVLNTLVDCDKDFYYLNLQLVILINIFENYVLDPASFDSNYIYKLNGLFRKAEKVTRDLFNTKNELQRIAGLISSEEDSKRSSNSKIEDRSLDGNKLTLNGISTRYQYLNKAYLMMCQQVSTCSNNFERIYEIVVSSKDAIDESLETDQEYAKQIDEIFDSTIELPKEETPEVKHGTEVEDENPNLMYLLGKVDNISEKLDSLSEKIDVNTDKIKSIVEECSKSSTKEIIAEFAKLDIETLSNQISELYKRLDDPNDNTDKEKVDNVIVASQVALASNDMNLTSYIKNLFANGVTLLKLSSAYACIRGLIDCYCRFGCGIQLNRDQRPYNYVGKFYDESKKQDFTGELNTNHKMFQQCFKLAYCDTINDIYRQSNTYIHVAKEKMPNLDKVAEKAINQAEFLNDTVGIDFEKIDFKAGAAKLLEQEYEWQKRLQKQIDAAKENIDIDEPSKEALNLYNNLCTKMKQLKERTQNYQNFIKE